MISTTTPKSNQSILRNNSGAAMVVVLMVITALTMIGGTALYKANADIGNSGLYEKSSKALYVAEAGIERAKEELSKSTINDILDGPDNLSGTPETDVDNGTFSFGTSVSFNGGIYTVSMTDNDDGDGNIWKDSDNFVQIQSTAVMPNGTQRTIQITVEKFVAKGVNAIAAVVTRGPIDINGGMDINGQDHDINGNYLKPGLFAVVSRSTFEIGSNASKIYGSDHIGINHGPLTKNDDFFPIVRQNTFIPGDPSTPEQILPMDDPGALKKIAKKGVKGSQYVTDPTDLTFPLSGVTYVELADGAEWVDIEMGNSSGVLIVHNSSNNAVMKNVNTGSFKGIMIVDDIVHVHTEILGTVYTLKPAESEGNVFGNGKGVVKYSSQAIAKAISDLNSSLLVNSWQEII